MKERHSLIVLILSLFCSFSSMVFLSMLEEVLVEKIGGAPYGLMALFFSACFGIILMYVLFVFKGTNKVSHKYIYVSYNYEDKSVFEMICSKYSGRIIKNQYTLSPGDSIHKSIRKNIQESAFVIVVVGENLSIMQKFEIKSAKEYNKRVVPIILNVENKIPSSLQKYSAITLEQFLET